MFELIEKLRQKPEGAKKRIAFFTSFFISLTIFIVWLSVIYPDVSNKKVVENSVISSSTPVDNLYSLFSEGFSEVKNKISELASVVSSISSSTPMYYESTTNTEAVKTTEESSIIEGNFNQN